MRIVNKFSLGVYITSIVLLIGVIICISCGYSMPIVLQLLMAIISLGSMFEALATKLEDIVKSKKE